ncbi:hypothetical protein KUM39_02900 [Streptomyces sp. J2-1]|uniref:hypothetical protein n=1 Tax=Streptomyces corallincola TaxID=2851888 RepID=UPI001C382B0D|nr:hypothetical protein [Streptomyces corallincola]MBV2353318.1 hypothetical protein [Streptomyces corallincola]
MIFFVTAGVSAILLSALGFDPDRAAYWRRWLGVPGYLLRRSLLALPPLAMALVLCHFLQAPPDRMAEALHGGGIGLFVAALLKADPGFRSIPKLRANVGNAANAADPRQAASALTWIHGVACHRFDVAAQRKITAHLGRLKELGPGSAELVSTAEEIAALLTREAADATPRSRPALQERLERIHRQISVLEDSMASGPQLRRTAYELAESLNQEMITRRWSRESAQPRQEGKEQPRPEGKQ